jgi:hypothetical protein
MRNDKHQSLTQEINTQRVTSTNHEVSQSNCLRVKTPMTLILWRKSHRDPKVSDYLFCFFFIMILQHFPREMIIKKERVKI